MGFTSYSILVIPYFVTPFIAYSIVKFNASFNETIRTVTSVDEIENYISSLILAARKLESNAKHLDKYITSECYLLSTLDKHRRQCGTRSCMCQTMEEKSEDGKLKRSHISKENWILFARQQLDEFLLKSPKEPSLHLTSACFDYYILKNYFKAIHSLHIAEGLNPSLSLSILIMFTKRSIEESMLAHTLPFIVKPEEDPNKLDPLNVCKAMKLFNKFMGIIDDCTSSNLVFWNILLSSNPNIFHLNQIGANIFGYLKKLNKMYNKAIKINSANNNFLYKYAIFLKHIVFDDIIAEEIFNRISLMKENKALSRNLVNKRFTVESNNLIALKVSGNLNTLGKILDANIEATARLQYEREEFKRINITQIMPSVLGKNHLEWVKDAYTRFLLPRVNVILGNFISNKAGYFSYADFILTILPNLKDDLVFVIFININKKMKHYLKYVESYKAENKNQYCVVLCDENDNLIGMNENMANWIGITLAEVKKSEINIESLIPEIYDKKKLIEEVKASNGYTCNVNPYNILRQLSEDEKEDDMNDEEKKVEVRIRCIREVYGSSYNLPDRILEAIMKIFIIIPTLKKESHRKLELANKPEENIEKLYNTKHEDLKSIASSSVTSILNKNLIHEFKEGLYEKKTPHTIRLLQYVIWGLYLLLFASCTIDWILSYQKANNSIYFYELIIKVTERINAIASVSVDARTLDLHIRGLEENIYYGDDFYSRTHKHVVLVVNK